MLTYASTVLFVKDINKSKRFYCDLLELEINHDFGTNIEFKVGLSIWQITTDHVVFQNQDKECEEKHNNRFELYFETEEIHNFHQKLVANEVEIFHPIREETWGQLTIRFFDPDGHLIEVGETMESFVTKMSEHGMTKEEIAKKTSISIEWLDSIIN